MTDFIHEHPGDAQNVPPASPPEPAEEAPLDEKTGQKRVYGYILILFVVAFFLLLWSFLMNQRSNEQVISELRGNAGALQSTLDRNVALEQENEELKAEVRNLETEVEELEEHSKLLEEENAALTGERDALQAALDEAREALQAYEEEPID